MKTLISLVLGIAVIILAIAFVIKGFMGAALCASLCLCRLFIVLFGLSPTQDENDRYENSMTANLAAAIYVALCASEWMEVFRSSRSFIEACAVFFASGFIYMMLWFLLSAGLEKTKGGPVRPR